MLHELNQKDSILNHYIAEIRDVAIQGDRLRFRHNLERIGQVLAFEISKSLSFSAAAVKTPLGTASIPLLKDQPVLATILRAGIPLYNGMLSVFDRADSAFVAAYRQYEADGKFDIRLEHLSCPSLEGRIVIVSDPMLATGSSIARTVQQLVKEGQPSELHIATAIASSAGIECVRSELPDAHIWVAAVDAELNDKGYIIPGLGDAGDLAFGPKTQGNH